MPQARRADALLPDPVASGGGSRPCTGRILDCVVDLHCRRQAGHSDGWLVLLKIVYVVTWRIPGLVVVCSAAAWRLWFVQAALIDAQAGAASAVPRSAARSDSGGGGDQPAHLVESWVHSAAIGYWARMGCRCRSPKISIRSVISVRAVSTDRSA